MLLAKTPRVPARRVLGPIVAWLGVQDPERSREVLQRTAHETKQRRGGQHVEVEQVGLRRVQVVDSGDKAHADSVRHTVRIARLVVARKRRAGPYREVVRVTDPLSHAGSMPGAIPLSPDGFGVDLQRFAHSTIVHPAADKPSRQARPRCLTPALPRRLAGFRWAPMFDPRAPTVHQFVPLSCALPDSR